MQFSIHFNQSIFINLAKAYDDIEFDTIDGSIYCFMRQFVSSGGCESIKGSDGATYYWIAHKKIIDELPMLGIKSKSAIYKRLKKFEECEVLEAHPKNTQMAKSYYKKGKNWDYLIFDPSDLNQNPFVSKSEPPSDLNQDYHNTNNHKYQSFIRDDDFSEDANKIMEFMYEESPELTNWDSPLTLDQADNLLNKYGFNRAHIESKLIDMPDFDYKSVYRTALKWLKKDRQKGWDQNYEQQHSQAAAYEAFD